MKKFLQLTFFACLVSILSVFVVFAEPIINLNLVTPVVVCSTGNDTVQYSVSASGIPANTNIVIYQSTDSTFNPYNAQGDSIGFIPGNSIPRDTINFGNCVKTLGIFIDACGASGQEGRNEYIILTSGNGIRVNNLGIDFSSQNNTGGATNADINIGASACGYKTPSAALINGLRAGSCNASNVIPAAPTDSIPANAIILCFTSDNVTANYSVNGLCNLGYPIYVIQSACTRTIGAFTNDSRCDAPARYRTTLAVDKRLNCSNNFTYDLCNIFDKDGTYAIRQQGTDTASVANNGIRRNMIDSCGGIDYTQLDFAADTTLKFRISNNFCNDGYHYIKAVTHPNGTQPVSNTIAYKLVCNDVTATTRTNSICSGDSAIINISSTDPNATFSWTISGGTNITGDVAGTGNTIRQLLTYNGTTKDSVTYNITSNDAGCTKTTAVKVIVNGIPAPVISGTAKICNGNPAILTVSAGQFDSIRWSTGAATGSIDVDQPGDYSVTAYKDGCSGTSNVNVVSNTVAITISGDTEICQGSSVTLTVVGQFDSIRWSNGILGNQITVSIEDSYTATAYLNGCSGTATVRVTDCQQQICNPVITGNRAFCQGDSIILDAGAGFASYLWNTGAITQTITVKNQGDYVVAVTGQNCTGRDSVNVTVNPIPQVTISGNTAICANAQTTLTANATVDSLRWNTNEVSSSITVLQPQTYSVIVYSNGCSNTASVQVTLLNAPTAFNLGNDTAFCGDFEKILSTGNQATVWSTGVTASQITVAQAGTYIGTITNTCGSVSDTIIIDKNELPVVFIGNDTTFCDGEIELVVSGQFRSYLWNTNEQTSSITVTQEGAYSVKVTDGNGCSNGDTINITSNCAKDLWLPNAFTPNSDGVNDVFLVRGNPGNTVIERFIIYNRWGLKVFEASNILPDDVANGWNGKYKGEPAQFEVYGYEVVARFNDGTKKTLKGNVTLLK